MEISYQADDSHRTGLSKYPEESCVADALMLVNIVNLPNLFYDSYHYKHLGITEGKISVEATMESYWEQVIPLSQTQFQDRYSLARLLARGTECEPYSYETDLERTLSEFVKQACMAEKNVHGYGIWENHICPPMIPIGNALSELHGADAEVVRIAILLHDLASIEDYSKSADHHIHGAQRAKQLLQEADYPSDKIELVAESILHHRGGSVLMQKKLLKSDVSQMPMLLPIYPIFRPCSFWHTKKKAWVSKREKHGSRRKS